MFVGGHVALDLVNTVAWRLDPSRREDRLRDDEALRDWAVSAGIASGPAVAGGVAQVRDLREAAYRVLHPMATAGSAPRRRAAADFEPLRGPVLDALARAEVVSVVPLEWRIPVRATSDLPAALALEVWRLLQFEDLTRLRQCADDGCGWLFLDRSRNGSRRWCSSADCGNRERARRHYRRGRA
ncbi:CGNR zinc finger domain-containing protein [Amycolatopsis thermophila]|uniref:RNA-binding Zn ribbon-like protein n=1 Tax=Amycolatopsis thermophila TaxID=206084 RepID=A0ABU0F3N8_9PSEU|nr:CGNR zinc finger domain-containing protein [Amycolatopsis thermophila]MDQ0382108.1 putative RNA-binding Zn ribbon-like protein [Amycolatopsis thermophila]